VLTPFLKKNKNRMEKCSLRFERRIEKCSLRFEIGIRTESRRNPRVLTLNCRSARVALLHTASLSLLLRYSRRWWLSPGWPAVAGACAAAFSGLARLMLFLRCFGLLQIHCCLAVLFRCRGLGGILPPLKGFERLKTVLSLRCSLFWKCLGRFWNCKIMRFWSAKCEKSHYFAFFY